MDPNDLNSLSEVESLSDSDWLDIASSRASEDNDSSLADSDVSDREDIESDYRPPSRRSLTSNGSGDIQGWEGIVEDSADEAPVSDPVINSDERTAASTLTDPRLSHLSLSFRAAALSESAVARHTALVDPAEDQRVKDALDQSMVSTLSGSRSNSLNGSVQTSVVHSRDLRLSFPDPLTSPRAQSLNPSYEHISVPTDNEYSLSDGDMQPSSGLSRETTAASIDSAPAADPSDVFPTLEVARVSNIACDEQKACVTADVHSSSVVDFFIVLYGASSEIKHRVVHTLIEKLMSATGCGFSALPQIDVPHNIRMLVNSGREMHCILSVVDRTESIIGGKEPGTLALAQKPSLAIIFMPSALTVVPEHTLYLPLLAQDTFDEEDDLFESSDRLLDAEHQWESLRVSKDRIVSSAFAPGRSAVVEEEEIRRASPARVARALRPLLPWTDAWSMQNLSSRHALTIRFAILSIVLGYLMNGSLSSVSRPAASTMQMVPRPLPPTPQVNISAALPGPTTSSASAMALVSSSLKEFALAVLSPHSVASTSSVATKAMPSPTASTAADPAPEPGAPSECECGCGLITWSGKVKAETDVALRPTPPAPSIGGQTFHKGGFAFVPPTAPVKGKGKARATEDDSLFALSTRIAGALTEYLDTCMAFAPSRHDVEEIVDALEELGQAIGQQTETALTQTKSMVDIVRQNIRARHERARSRAKEMRAAGERWFSSVTEVSARVRDRVNLAKENARVLRDTVAETHARRARHERWEARREHRRDRRLERRARRAQTVG
ncbi:hypothetical protein BN946_scf184797.g4 [Trametes cinnabarina]|uniref:Uncharacterized protein n=1 Tax=Pycnoporus cinnabarinus TaxID=5643 RepID=A0A060T029_PYCCI|nr:hypothetical protein BN946_scf184797.g4 [Trametes cinnabarina]